MDMTSRVVVGIGAVCTGIAVSIVVAAGHTATAQEKSPNLLAFNNATGQLRTFNVRGPLDPDNPFFHDLGTNGRSCVTCHDARAAWTITPETVQARFDATQGLDPIFRNNDGSTCEGAVPQSLDEERQAYGLLLSRGLIRVGLDVPPDAEFVIDKISDPNHCQFSSNDASLYRRPLPATNLRFLSAVMWDGRESSDTSTIVEDLMHQANDATRGHEQAARDLTADEAAAIVEFETGLFSAQATDHAAGGLATQGATGGPVDLSRQSFFLGMNDPVGLNPTGASFDPDVFTIFNPWARLSSADTDPYTETRLAIARGQQIFNTKPLTISGVAGLNGVTFGSGVAVADSFTGTCSVCHNTPNAGNHSLKVPLDIGTSDPSRAPYLPVYTLRNLATGQKVDTTDPGRAMITGRWADIGKFKGPVLRGLAGRAPYFHNGSAMTLEEVVDFYNVRFQIGLTPQERADLIAFLRAL